MRRTPADRSRAWYQANAARYDRRHPGLPGDLAFYASLARCASVLEIGAGTGRVTAALAAAGNHVLAVDNAPAMLAIAAHRLRSAGNIELLLADACSLPLCPGFDMIVLAYRTLQHLDAASRPQFWLDARSLLSPGGRLAFDTWHGPTAPMGGTRGIAISPATVEDIRDEIGRAGLRAIAVQSGFEKDPEPVGFNRVWVLAASSR